MAALFIEGWDKFGGLNSNSAGVVALLTAGEWTTAGTNLSIVAPLSANGQALRVSSNLNTAMLSKTLAASYARLIGGVRFNLESGASGSIGVGFTDAGAAQASIVVNVTTGTISVVRGFPIGGTVVATSTASVSVGSTHYLEWDITFGNAGAYQVWLDGSPLFPVSSTGDTTATANNSANGFGLVGTNSVQVMVYDDLYLFDTSGATNNAVLLTSPRVETQFPNGDGAIQFAIGAAILGSSVTRSSAFSSNAANQWRARPFTPVRNCTLNSISFLPALTNAALNFRPIVYSDSAGLPGTLLGAGATVTGMTANVAVALPLTTPQALTAGTQYWLGYMCDALSGGSSLYQHDGAAAERIGVSTFASGAPSSPPSLSTVGTTLIWGIVTGIGVNWYEVSQNPPQGNFSYVFDATIGHEDLYSFPALTAAAPTIYAAAVKGNISKSDAGAKTLTLRIKSGATDSPGSAASLAPATSYGWMTSLFPTDPATSAAWSLVALNAAQAGVKVET